MKLRFRTAFDALRACALRLHSTPWLLGELKLEMSVADPDLTKISELKAELERSGVRI
jgi:hypothetical protein